MSAAVWLVTGILAAAGAAPRVVVVSEAPQEAEPGKVETASDGYRLRLGGVFEGTLGRDQFGNAISIPRMRLRAEALVSLQLEVGFVAEADLSPWSNPNLKEDGPGILRDAYARMALGNKKILDLGEARLGYMALPLVAEQGVLPHEMLFLTGTLGREAWLPGRELSAVYELGGYRWGIPASVQAGLGSGVGAPAGAALLGGGAAPEPHERVDGSAAAAVPMTAGTTYRGVVDPALAVRVEGQPAWRWTRTPLITLGASVMGRPLAAAPMARASVAMDAEMRWAAFQARAVAMVVDTARAPFLDGKALAVEGAVQVIPDFADLRARYEVAYGVTDVQAHRLALGMALFYVDGAASGPLSLAGLLPVVPVFGRSFTILWQRVYDLTRYDPRRTHRPPSSGDDAVRAGWLVSEVRYWAGGDTDQLVMRIAF